MNPRDEITAVIPHRDPFLFLDEIVRWDRESISCRKTFTGKEAFFQGHYPDFPLVPGVILCEATMQAGAVWLGKTRLAEHGENGTKTSGEDADDARGDGFSESVFHPVVAKMGEVRFKRMIRPGDTVDIEVRFKEKMTSVHFLHGKVSCEGKIVLQFDFSCVLS